MEAGKFCPVCRYEYRPEIEICPDCGAKLVDELENLSEFKELDLVSVYTANSETEANIIKSVLEGDGIESVFSSDAARSVHPFTINGLGKVKVMVNKKDAERAKELVKNV